MKRLLKIFLLLFIFTSQAVFAEQSQSDKSYKAYEKATEYYKNNNYKQTIVWLQKSYDYKPTSEVAFNFGLLYDEKIKNIQNAMKWYEKAYELGDVEGGYNLAMLYKQENDYDNAIKWYKRAIDMGHISAIKNLGYLYRTEKKDNLLGSAYMIALIDKKYSKEKVFDYLRNKLKIDEATLKKAYELQKNLIPNPYTGGID
jgi:TPR repeat protein